MTIKTTIKKLDYVTELHTGSASSPVPLADETSEREPEAEFDRFEDLTHKLVQVPKGELDDKRRKA